MKNHSWVIKLSTLLLFLLTSAMSEGREKLILFGGGGYTPEAVAKFVDWAGGKDAKILILPWATSEPQYEFDEVKEVLSAYKTAQIIRGLGPDEKSYSKKELIAQIESATGIFFPGGDQVDLMARINSDKEIKEELLHTYHQGVVFAGFSAGTAISSKTMITGRGDFSVIDSKKVETAEGLGLIDKAVIDQHFIARQRQNRMMSVLQGASENLGIGIDEKMAFVLEDGQKGSVLGDSYIMVFHRKEPRVNFEISLLKKGDTILLP